MAEGQMRGIEEQSVTYLNCYLCEDCYMEWHDEWECMCNDKCPVCRSEIEPFASAEITLE